MTEQAHFLINDFYIVSVPQYKRDGSLYPVILEATAGMVMYHSSIGTHIGHKNYLYNKLFMCAKKIKDFISPRNEPLIFLDYW